MRATSQRHQPLPYRLVPLVVLCHYFQCPTSPTIPQKLMAHRLHTVHRAGFKDNVDSRCWPTFHPNCLIQVKQLCSMILLLPLGLTRGSFWARTVLRKLLGQLLFSFYHRNNHPYQSEILKTKSFIRDWDGGMSGVAWRHMWETLRVALCRSFHKITPLHNSQVQRGLFFCSFENIGRNGKFPSVKKECVLHFTFVKVSPQAKNPIIWWDTHSSQIEVQIGIFLTCQIFIHHSQVLIA